MVSILNRLPKDVGVMIYRTLHLLSNLHDEYRKTVRIIDYGYGIERYEMTDDDNGEWYADPFNWREELELDGDIYTFDAIEVGAKLPQRYFLSSLKTDMVTVTDESL